MQVAWQDKRKVVQMIACSMFQTFLVVFWGWIWLFAVNKLGLSRTEVGEAISWSILCGVAAAFPVLWLVDRFSVYRLMPFFCAISVCVLFLFLNIHSVTGLILATSLMAVLQPLYNSADIMVYRTTVPENIGSVTSTNSCLRGFFNGCMAMLMGWLIQATGGNYHWAYIIACSLTVLGLVPLFLYRWLMSRDQTLRETRLAETAIA